MADRRSLVAGASGYTVLEWVEEARRRKQADIRCFVVLLCFAGARCAEDAQDWPERLSADLPFMLFVHSADLAEDAAWDLAVPDTFATLMAAASEGLLDGLGGGPPC